MGEDLRENLGNQSLTIWASADVDEDESKHSRFTRANDSLLINAEMI